MRCELQFSSSQANALFNFWPNDICPNGNIRQMITFSYLIPVPTFARVPLFSQIILGVVLAYYETVTNAYRVKCLLWFLAKWHLSELQMITLSYLCVMFILITLLQLIMTIPVPTYSPVSISFFDFWPNDICPNGNIRQWITFSYVIPVPTYARVPLFKPLYLEWCYHIMKQ